VPARVYALILGEPEGGSEVVTGSAPILGFEALVLFDSGATHSFISIVFIGLSRLVGTDRTKFRYSQLNEPKFV
jgi:hypothetical protein